MRGCILQWRVEVRGLLIAVALDRHMHDSTRTPTVTVTVSPTLSVMQELNRYMQDVRTKWRALQRSRKGRWGAEEEERLAQIVEGILSRRRLSQAAARPTSRPPPPGTLVVAGGDDSLRDPNVSSVLRPTEVSAAFAAVSHICKVISLYIRALYPRGSVPSLTSFADSINGPNRASLTVFPRRPGSWGT